MQAIILAGGFGTRLKSVTGDAPKPLAPVAGRPFLCWLLEYMAGQGVTDAVLCVHHQSQAIISYFGSGYAGIRLDYSYEEKPLGTGGAIQRALCKLAPRKPVLALNGDSLVKVDYRLMLARHHHHKRSLTIAGTRVSDCSRYSRLSVLNGLITRYDTLGDASPGDVSVGVYMLSPEVFDAFDLPEAFSFERDFLAVRAPSLRPAVYQGVNYFIDIGVPADYARAQTEIPALITERLVA